jgi:hypothetical protein
MATVADIAQLRRRIGDTIRENTLSSFLAIAQTMLITFDTAISKPSL